LVPALFSRVKSLASLPSMVFSKSFGFKVTVLVLVDESASLGLLLLLQALVDRTTAQSKSRLMRFMFTFMLMKYRV
jgi:hypothetical protein